MAQPTVLDHVIKWNLDKARKTSNPEDRARYEENVRNLKEYKNG